jgi:type IV pilus assembly protein PilW
MRTTMFLRPTRRGAAGFTLVEIMIALLIGLIAVIVIMQTYAVSEGFKRTSSSGSDAQTNGGIALYMVERDLRIAGYGFSAVSANCPSMVAYIGATGQTRNVPLSPSVQLNPAGVLAGDANTDVVLVAYGSSDSFLIPISATQAGSNYTLLSNYNGVRSGDLMVGYSAGVANSCFLFEATAVPFAAGNCSGGAASGTFNLVQSRSGSYRNSHQSCNVVPAQHNLGATMTNPVTNASVAPLSAAAGWVYNLGPSPQVKVYAVLGGNLKVCDMLSQDCSVAAGFNTVMTDIVSLRAVFGNDPAGLASVSGWSRTPNNAIAVALELTARSPLKEKPSNGGTTCDATLDKAKPDRTQNWFGPTLSPNDGTLNAAQIDLSTLTDWQCYRYKMFQTTVPVRNAIWTPTN